MHDKIETAFITICSKKKENACYEHRMFGSLRDDSAEIGRIKIGTPGLLYNYETDELTGIFYFTGNSVADSDRLDRDFAGVPLRFKINLKDNTEKNLTNALKDFLEPSQILFPFDLRPNADLLRTILCDIGIVEKFEEAWTSAAKAKENAEKCFLMVCRKGTEDVCLKRLLFGTTPSRAHLIKDVRKGQKGLLYNYETEQLMGVFEATHDNEPMTFDEEAFGKNSSGQWQYTMQFTVKLAEGLKETQRLPKALSIFEASGVSVRPIGTYGTVDLPGNRQEEKQGKKIPKAALYGPELLSCFKIAYESSVQVRRNGTRAAIGAIMGRNMSHNIGSHVLSYLSDQEATGNGFYKYIQGRMDFIAEISTARPTWSLKMRLLEDILKPFVYGDLKTCKGELLDNIGRSIYVDRDGKRIYLDASRIHFNIHFDDQWSVGCPYEGNKFKEWKLLSGRVFDPLIEVPHGIIGCHALYSILENFIRNSIKHNGDSIKADILGHEDKHYDIKITVHDNRGFVKISLSDNISDFSPYKYDNISRYIDGDRKDLINEGGAINRDGGWGIKEMRISAAWLRNIAPEDVQFKSQEQPLLNIGKTKEGKLSYDFLLLKPADVLIVDPAYSGVTLTDGIEVVTNKNEIRYLCDEGRLRQHFLIVNGQEMTDFIAKNVSKFTERIFFVSDEISTDGRFIHLSSDEYREILREPEMLTEALYEKWVQHISPVKGWLPRIYCNDEDMQSTDLTIGSPTEEGQIYFEHPATKPPVESARYLFWEPYSTGAKSTLSGKMKVLRSGDRRSKRRIFYELMESALTRIVIVDERIYSDLHFVTTIDPQGIEIEIYKLLSLWNVEVINFSRVENSAFTITVLDRNGRERELPWNEYIEKRRITFLSIHQTIIDAIGEDIFRNAINSSINPGSILIHSGRGKLGVLKGFKFVEFTNIKRLIIDQPDKHQLTDLFMNVRSDEDWTEDDG